MYEFPTPTPVRVQARLAGGSLDVVAEERATAQVTVEPYDGSAQSAEAAEQTRVELRGDVLAIEAPEGLGGWLFHRSARLRVEIRVPSGSAAECRVASAPVSCRGHLTDLIVNGASGTVRAEQVAGDASINLASGDVRLGTIGGALTVHTASGSMAVDDAHGEVHATVASGRVHIHQARSGIRVTSASGGVMVDALHRGSARINSASGDVSVGVPAGTGVWLDLSTISGNTRNELEMVGEPADNGRDLSLQVRTISGDIDVRRAAPV